jgi:hypothetical protein
MPEERFTLREWGSLYRSARNKFAQILYDYERAITTAEFTQMKWLRQAGHSDWQADLHPPKSNWALLLEDKDKQIANLSRYILK